MPKILEDLYFGNIAPCEMRMVTDSELWHLAKRAADCKSHLAERLNEDEHQLLNVLTNAQQEIDRVTAMENFIQGFRLGVQLMAECLGGNANG